ncbi:MAG: BofC C-terminal domain-containing protein [bacterium]|jgi:hypothetical protein
MRSSESNSRPLGYLYLVMVFMGIILLVVGIRWSGLLKNHSDSRQVATLPQSPPLLIEDRRYELCGHTIEQSHELEADVRLLSPKELARLYNANTYQVSQEKLQIFSDQTGLCPECKNNIVVGLYEGEVAIFYGTPGGPQQLKERTQIQAERLPPQVVVDLKSGIPISDQEELLHVLEGLMN